MNTEEIDYWLRYFSNHNHGFMSEDGKKITLFKVFKELKELHYLLKIQNDYINELEQENQELKKELEEKNKPQIFIDTQDIEERYAEGLYQDYLEEENKKYKNQQKYFIEYMNKTIEELECDDVGDEELKGYLIQEIDTFKEILLNYKSIMGVSKYKESGE